MIPIKNLDEGTRFLATACTLEKVSSYISSFRGKEITKWRHCFTTPLGETLVYTGEKLIAAQIGKRYDITATVKRHETKWHQTRICRPIVEIMDNRQHLLNLKPRNYQFSDQ